MCVTGAITGVVAGDHSLYRCLLTLGMLQYKLGVITITIISFSISNTPPNCFH